MGLKQLAIPAARMLAPEYMKYRDLRAQHNRQLTKMMESVNLMPEQWEERIRSQYFQATGHELDLENPKRFTEKIQWRKLYDCNPLYSTLADKYAVRDWVKNKIGEEYLIPLLGVWDRPEQIAFRTLPNRFVLKTNNASATNIIVRDKQSINKRIIKENLRFFLATPFWAKSGEMHYKAIKPRIIAEQFIEIEGHKDLPDYKFFCFDGKPKYCQIITDRNSEEHIDFFDINWNHQEFVGLNRKCRNAPYEIKKPSHFEEMVLIAEKLSVGFSFVRVDLYEAGDKVYFGEMTFTPASGNGVFTPDNWDYKLGEQWNLDTSIKDNS